MLPIRTALGILFFMTGFQDYSKPVLTFEEQLALLKSRGLNIQDESSALKFLSNVSYYRLSGYWWDLCRDQERNVFKENITFKTIVDRYTFDRKLRIIVIDAIERIEIALRTKMIYHLSHSDGWYWFDKLSIFENEEKFLSNKETIEREINYSKELFIKEHKEKYGDIKVPSLKVIEVISFGTLSKLFNNLNKQHSAKGKISYDMGLTSSRYLSSLLYMLTFLRNTSAHHGRLWNRPIITTPSWIKKPKTQWLTKRPDQHSIRKIYYSICCMVYLCDNISEGHNIRSKIIGLLTDLPHTISLNSMGFPSDWQSEDFWKI